MTYTSTDWVTHILRKSSVFLVRDEAPTAAQLAEGKRIAPLAHVVAYLGQSACRCGMVRLKPYPTCDWFGSRCPISIGLCTFCAKVLAGRLQRPKTKSRTAAQSHCDSLPSPRPARLRGANITR